MPYDAQGQWIPEDDSTSAAVAKVASTASPIMKQATGDAMRMANRRGLYNSTIAAGAGVDAALRSATAIGAADANATLQKNLSKQGFVQGTGLQGQQIAGQKDITGMNIAGQKDVTGMQIAGQKDVTGMQIQGNKDITGINIASAERMQTAELVSKAELQRAEINSRESMLGRQLTSEETRQAEQIGANKYMQQQQLTSAEEQQRRQITSTEEQQRRQITSTEGIQTADQELRREMNALQTSTQQAIAQMNVAAKEKEDAVRSATQMQALYTQMFDAILSNPDLPADQRTLYLEHAKNLGLTNLNLVKGVYGANITWPAAA